MITQETIEPIISDLIRLKNIAELTIYKTRNYNTFNIISTFRDQYQELISNLVLSYQGETSQQLHLVVKETKGVEDFSEAIELMLPFIIDKKIKFSLSCQTILDSIHLLLTSTFYKLKLSQ